MSATVSSVVDTILAALRAAGIEAERDKEDPDTVFAPAPGSKPDAWVRSGMTVRVECPRGWHGRRLCDNPSSVSVLGRPLRRQGYALGATAKIVERVRAGLAALAAERKRRDAEEREQKANAKAERAELAPFRASLKASGATVTRVCVDESPPRYSVTWDHEIVTLDRLPALLRAMADAKGAST